MSFQPETEQQHTEVEWIEQPAHGRESPAPPRLSEGQLKLALTEMAESDPTFLKQLFKLAASTEDGPSSSPSKAGHSPSSAKDGADTDRLVSPPLCPPPRPSTRTAFRVHGGANSALSRAGRGLDVGLPSNIFYHFFLCLQLVSQCINEVGETAAKDWNADSRHTSVCDSTHRVTQCHWSHTCLGSVRAKQP